MKQKIKLNKTKSKVFSLERLYKVCIKKSLVKIGSVRAEIFLIWTNVAKTIVAWTNVTVTIG